MKQTIIACLVGASALCGVCIPTVTRADSAPAADAVVYLFAVFTEHGKVLDGLRYNKKTFKTKAECEDFFKTGGGKDPNDRGDFATSLLQLHSVVEEFAEKHPDGVLRMVCSADEQRPVKGEDI